MASNDDDPAPEDDGSATAPGDGRETTDDGTAPESDDTGPADTDASETAPDDGPGADTGPAAGDGPAGAPDDGFTPETALAGEMTETEEEESYTPYALGLGMGVAAWLVGYLAFYLRYAGEIRDSVLANVIDAAGGGVYQAVGWVFFNAHNVMANVDAAIIGPNTTNFLRDAGPLAYLAPPVFLLLAGAVVGYRARTDGPGDAAVTGLLLVPGYLVCSALGVYVFSLSTNAVSVSPDPVTGVLLAGVVYPAVCGAIGSLAGDRL